MAVVLRFLNLFVYVYMSFLLSSDPDLEKETSGEEGKKILPPVLLSAMNFNGPQSPFNLAITLRSCADRDCCARIR